MKNVKKVLLTIGSLMLTAAIAIGGTVAYLQHDDSDVNVMTLGNVKIEQIEQERDADGNLVDFKQAKPAYPAVGTIAWDDDALEVNGTEYKVFDNGLKNVVDKIVTVNNTGKSDAYIRTIVAIEAPNGDPNNLIHINYNKTDIKLGTCFITEIDGVDYYIMPMTYGEALASGTKSAPSLLQLFLDSATTNEDCAKFGESWQVLVVSQAVQTKGFDNAQTALDTAFGELDENNHPWTNTVFVQSNDEAEILNALTSGQNVILNTDIVEIDDAAFDGNGSTVTLAGSGSKDYGYLSFNPGLGNSTTVKDLNVTGTGFVEVGHTSEKSKTNNYVVENLVVKDMTATLCVNNGGENIASAFAHYGTAILKDCVMNGTVSAKDGYTAYDASFVNGTATTIEGGEYGRIYMANQAAITIKDAKIGLIDGNYQGIVTRNTGAKLEIQAGSEVDMIDVAAFNNTYTSANAIVIRSGAVVDTLKLDMRSATRKTILNIEDGATVNHLFIGGVEVDYNTWINS